MESCEARRAGNKFKNLTKNFACFCNKADSGLTPSIFNASWDIFLSLVTAK